MTEILHEGNLFHLRNAEISYVLYVMPNGVLAHLYFGARLNSLYPQALLRRMGVAEGADFSLQAFALDRLMQEYPAFGLGDLREGALAADAPDGTDAVDLRFVSAAVEKGKPRLAGLPATFGGDCQTLRVRLRDAKTGLAAELLYTVFADCAAIARSQLIINDGDAPLRLTKAMSLCLDLPDSGWDLITLHGAWARERGVYRRPLMPGEQGASTRSGASSLQTSPFMALARPHATEDAGEAIGLALVYSGNFTAQAAVGQHDITRVLLGVNDRDFSWLLAPQARFQTPEAVLVYASDGLGGMSRAFHRLWREHLLPPRWAHAARPVLLNSWEAAYFDIDEDKLFAIAQAAAQAGVELLVVDDGWFGRRDDDTTSLGDWTPHPRKLPQGLAHLAQRVRAAGVQFGLWMEPEMISPQSELYQAHPDWCLHIAGREGITWRNQLVLDMGRPEVQRFVYEAVSRTLRESGAAYLKWDMNRNFANIGTPALPPERQKELPHRYILGLYAVLERITREFPDVLIEGCAAGGGRFDAGMLYYVPQIWCSDNTDALARCRIQFGTSLVFPPSAMGSHVSAVPSHQTGRVTPMETRFAVALGGCFGYELDPRRLSKEEQDALRAQVAFAQRTQTLRVNGAFYRLLSPFAGNETAWMTVAGDRREALFTIVRERALANTLPMLVRLRGLDPAQRYRVEETNEVYGGDELMLSGLPCAFAWGDAASLLYTLKAVDD